MGLTRVWAVEMEGRGVTVNAMAPAGITRMTGNVPGLDAANPPPEMDPELNGPLIAYLASDAAGGVTGQVFGRRGYGYTIFQQPRPIALLFKDGPMTAADIAANFDTVFGEHLQPVGIPSLRRKG
jgi:3-oxoacyl-[acyl-carrier protein] reductase